MLVVLKKEKYLNEHFWNVDVFKKSPIFWYHIEFSAIIFEECVEQRLLFQFAKLRNNKI